MKQSKQDFLKEALEQLLLNNNTITFRSVLRAMSGVFRHVTDITRNAERRELVQSYIEKQKSLRALAEKVDKNSKSRLAVRCAQLEQRISELEHQRELLIVSHKAMILAVGELGGMAAWRRFFVDYQSVVKSIDEMGAMSKE